MNMRSLTPEDYWKAISSKKWLVTSVIVVSLFVASAFCLLSPKSYRSSTKIWAEGSKIKETYVKGRDPGEQTGNSPEDRLMDIRQSFLGRKMLSQVAESFQLFGYDKNQPESAESDNAVRALRTSIKVEASKDKMFIEVSFANEDPRLARDVTARLGELVVEETQREREQGVDAATDFLQQELIAAKAELEVKEKLISQFKQEHLGELPQQLEGNLRALDRLQQDMKSQNELTSNITNRLTSLDKAIKDYEDGERGDLPALSPKRIRDPRLARMRELERQLVPLSAMYKDTYPDIVQIKEELRRLREMTSAQYKDLQPEPEESPDGAPVMKRPKTRAIDAYHGELLKQREEINLELDAIKRRQARITAEMAQYQTRVDRTPEREQRLMTLVRDYENLQKNYQSLLDKKLNAGIAGNLEKRRKGAKFTIVDQANLPTVPEKPNIPLVMLIGLGIGCGIGFGGAVGLELLGRGFRSPEEVEAALGLPVLAAIPLYESAFGGAMKSLRALPERNRAATLLASPPGSQSRLRTSQRQLTGPGNGKSTIHPTVASNGTPGLDLVSMWRPRSFVAEQFRVAATRLELMGNDRKSTVTVVTSAVMSEGKSSTSINLGYILAKDLARRTIIIDCDFKRPMQHSYAGIRQEPGLAEVLHGTKPLEACLQRLGDTGPWVLPAGSVGDSPLALSNMHQVADLLTELRPKFEYIILDAPPILPLADMHVFASMADVLALVIRAETTGRDVVQKALKILGDMSHIGIVLNGINAQSTPYYMQQEYYRESYHEQLK